MIHAHNICKYKPTINPLWVYVYGHNYKAPNYEPRSSSFVV